MNDGAPPTHWVLCLACAQIALLDASVRPHKTMRSVGFPNRLDAIYWVINYRCATCGCRWSYHLHPGYPDAGFQLRSTHTNLQQIKVPEVIHELESRAEANERRGDKPERRMLNPRGR